MLDGAAARAFSAESRAGAVLDSAGDIVFFGAGALSLLMRHPYLISEYAPAAGVIAVLKLAGAASGIFRYGRPLMLHTAANKAAGAMLFVFLGLSFVLVSPLFLRLTLAVCILAAAEELLIIILIREPDLNIRSLFCR